MPGPDLPGEDGAAVHARAQPQAGVEGEDLPHRQQHVLLVLAGAHGCTRGEVELAAVDREVRRLEADPARVDGLLGSGDQCVEPGGGRLSPGVLDQLVETSVLQERQRRRAVLGVDATLRDRAPQARGHEARHRLDRRQRRPVVRRGGHGAHEARADAAPVVEVAGVEGGGRHGTDEDLAALRGALEPDQVGGGGAGQDELTVGAAHEEPVDVAALDPDRQREPHPCGRLRRLAQRPDLASHADGGRRRPALVTGAAEEQQHGIAAELGQGPTERTGDVEQPGEAGLDDPDDGLGPDLALPGEPLGDPGEAGDVGEDERAGQPPVSPRLVVLGDPLAHQARDVGLEGVPVRHARHHRWSSQRMPVPRTARPAPDGQQSTGHRQRGTGANLSAAGSGPELSVRRRRRLPLGPIDQDADESAEDHAGDHEDDAGAPGHGAARPRRHGRSPSCAAAATSRHPTGRPAALRRGQGVVMLCVPPRPRDSQARRSVDHRACFAGQRPYGLWAVRSG